MTYFLYRALALYAEPTNSLAIQIKSNKNDFMVSNKIRYLVNLETPYLVGVVDRNKLSMSIYSGEYLPLYFALKGPNTKRLRIGLRKLVRDDHFYWKNNKYKSIVLGFPKIIELKVDDNALTLSGCILDSKNHSFVNVQLHTFKTSHIFCTM